MTVDAIFCTMNHGEKVDSLNVVLKRGTRWLWQLSEKSASSLHAPISSFIQRGEH